MTREFETCIYWNSSTSRCIADNYFPSSIITCYNETSVDPTDPASATYGACDGSGTCALCSKYSPRGLAFYTHDGLGSQVNMPIAYVIRNLRAIVGQCCHWSDDDGIPYKFRLVRIGADLSLTDTRFPDVTTVIEAGEVFVGGWAEDTFDSTNIIGHTGASFYITPKTGVAVWNGDVSTKCSVTNARKWYEGLEGEIPCNGCNTNCQYYIGPRFEHLTEAKLVTGQYVTAKQIQELRFYTDNWSKYSDPDKVWEDTWKDPYLWAWHSDKYAVDSEGNKRLKVTRVYISDYENGTISTEDALAISAGTALKNSEVTYPTLISEIDEDLDPPIKITYPFEDSTYRHFTYGKNHISVFGTTFRGVTVYAVNALFTNVPNPSDLSSADIATLVDTLSEQDSDYLYSTTSDDGGFFEFIQTIELKYPNEVGYGKNPIYVFVQSPSTGTWLYDKIEVRFKFYHSLVAQTSFVSTDADESSLQDATIRGSFYSIKGANSTSNMYWEYAHTPLGSSETTYYYYVAKTQLTDEVQSGNWKPINRCGYIAVEIDDLNLNRVVPPGCSEQWTLDSATLTQEPYIEGLKAETVKYEEYYKDVDGWGIPANTIILRPVNEPTLSFPNTETDTLTITYTYRETKQAPYWSGDTLDDSMAGKTIASSCPVDVNFGNTSFLLQNISLFTQDYTTEFADETGRTIGCKRNRFLTQTRLIHCRDVEIYYAWRAPFNKVSLYPSRSRIITGTNNFGQTVLQRVVRTHAADCGDHDLSRTSIGPMWYPYTNCGSPEYNFWDENFVVDGETITAASVGLTAVYERLRGPDSLVPITLEEHHTLFTCLFDHTFGNFERVGINEFIGYCRARGPVDLTAYRVYGWTEPKFGNKGREYVRMNRHLQFAGYIDTYGQTSYRWMPVFDEVSVVSPASEDRANPLMNLMCTSVGGVNVGEVFETTRYDQSDIVTSQSTTSYFPGSPYLKFKGNSSIQWAWEEMDAGLTRGTYPNKITGVSLSVPDNVDNYQGIAYRTRASEGSYTLLFTPPVYEDNGTLSEYATFTLGSGPAREYDIATEQWLDNDEYGTDPSVTGTYVTYSTLFSELNLLSHKTSSTETAYYYPGIVVDSVTVSKLPSIEVNLQRDGSKYIEYKYSEVPDSWNGYNTYTDGLADLPVSEQIKYLKVDEHGLMDLDNVSSLSLIAVYPSDTAMFNVSDVDLQNYTFTSQTDQVDVTIKINSSTLITSVSAIVAVGGYYDCPQITVYGSNDESAWTAIGTSEEVRGDPSVPHSAVTYEITITGETWYRYVKFTFGERRSGRALGLYNLNLTGKVLVQREETVYVNEQKCQISTGSYGDVTLHPSNGRVLFDENHASDYLRLSVAGDNDFAAVSKSRGHKAYDQHSDGDEVKTSKNIAEYEAWQRELYEKASGLMHTDTIYTSYFHPDEVEFFRDKLGVELPSWTLTMTSNTSTIQQLYGSVPGTPNSWNAPGHKYYHDETSLAKIACFIGESPVRLVFSYGVMHVNHGSGPEQPYEFMFWYPPGYGTLVSDYEL